MSKPQFVGVDIETTGLHPEIPGSKIYCITVNDGKRRRLHTKVEEVRKLLEDDNITKIIHNAGFDCYWLQYLHGIRVRNIWDTQLCEQVLQGYNQPVKRATEKQLLAYSTKLGYTLKRYGLVKHMDKSMGEKFALRDPRKPLTEEEKQYALDDVEYLPKLQAMQEYLLRKHDLMRVANLENMCVSKVVDMRIRGIGFHEATWMKIYKDNLLEHRRILKRMPNTVENWNSEKQIKKFFAKRGIFIDSLTNMEKINRRAHDPILADLIKLRVLAKRLSTYGDTWTQDDQKINTVDRDGRVRASFMQILNTGRFSCSHPNMQQLPSDTLHRTAFIPRKGHVFVIGDFTGQEIGIMAAASKEELWIKAMLREEDVHSLTASIMYKEWAGATEKGCTFPRKCTCKGHKKMRKETKTINFGLTYGGGAGTIDLDLPLRDIKKLVYKYRRTVPKLFRWLYKNAAETERTGVSYSADPYRRRRFVRSGSLFTIGMNNPIQSSGANMIKLSMVSTDLPIVMIIHDEIVVEVPKEKAKAAVKELKAVMEKAAEYCTGIPGLIKVSPMISTSLLKPDEEETSLKKAA